MCVCVCNLCVKMFVDTWWMLGCVCVCVQLYLCVRVGCIDAFMWEGRSLSFVLTSAAAVDACSGKSRFANVAMAFHSR
jgi:hypothetical protein